jgi:DNA polymerase III delta prime subunit
MEKLDIHKNIKHKLDCFIESNKIPHMIFYGPSGSGKKTLINDFIHKIYKNIEKKDEYLMNIDCEFMNGIKFIRNELKFFAKTNIVSNKNFKTILLINADKLTFDAQSALRRCIEVFSNTTRFILIVKNINKLLKPIISRFCKIHVFYPLIDDVHINLHQYKITKIKDSINKYNIYINKRNQYLKNKLVKMNDCSVHEISKLTVILINRGYSCLDIINYITTIREKKEYHSSIVIMFNQIKQNIKNEETLIFYILFLLLRFKDNLEILSIVKYG